MRSVGIAAGKTEQKTQAGQAWRRGSGPGGPEGVEPADLAESGGGGRRPPDCCGKGSGCDFESRDAVEAAQESDGLSRILEKRNCRPQRPKARLPAETLDEAPVRCMGCA